MRLAPHTKESWSVGRAREAKGTENGKTKSGVKARDDEEEALIKESISEG